MKFTSIFLSAVAFVSVSASAIPTKVSPPITVTLSPLPTLIKEPVPCDSKKHPCRFYLDRSVGFCTPLWYHFTRQCVESGCIKWVRDPLEECNGTTKPAIALPTNVLESW